MLPQLTVYAKILYLLMVAISGALCSDYVIMSQCAHNKAIHIAHDGKVSVTDTPTTQNITIAGTHDFLAKQTETNVFKVTLFAKETQRYLCFNNNWKLVGMVKLQDSCYFKESIVHGYFEFRSILNLKRRVGFTHRGKPVGPKKNVTDACYHFEKVAASEFSRTYTTSIAATSTGGSNGHNSSNNNSISATSNSRIRHSSSNLNSAKKESSALTHRHRHRKNRTQIGHTRLHHVQEHQEVHTRLRHHQLSSNVPEEVGGGKRKKKKKKKALPHGHQVRQQYLNPKDPAHRRAALELHEQQHYAEGKPHEHSGDSDMVTNVQDEYSNDDASAIQQDLPNTLDSSTDYLYSSSGSISSTRHMAEQHSKKHLLPGSTNRRRATIRNLSSPSSSSGHSSVDVNLLSRSSSYQSKDSQSPKKYYKTLNPSLVVASHQSTVLGDKTSDTSNKIAVTGLVRTNHNDKILDDCARRSTSLPRRRSAKCTN